MNYWNKDRSLISSTYDDPEFDLQYMAVNTPFGSFCQPDRTTWTIWSPEATQIQLILYASGSDREPDEELLRREEMISKGRGVWSLTLCGDFRGVFYTYRVTVLGKTKEIADPYARACGINGQRSMVVMLSDTDPDGWEEDHRIRFPESTAAVIWEVHVRDFSEADSSGMKNRGLYLAFTEKDTHVPDHPELKTGIAYLQELGITHVHLLPCMDFMSVDEHEPLSSYNWGYDPFSWFIPEGSYATDTRDGAVRIREFKQMVQGLHQAGIGVILDVVFNHVYYMQSHPLQALAPDYYFRTWPDGTPANGSGCGNEVATERPMVRQMLIQSLLYWAEEYHIDGFRFDLMGLIDVETMNLIRKELDQLPSGREILMYGEPWAAEPPQMRRGAIPADKAHVRMLSDRIAIFNDETRDAIKGNVFDMYSSGFINGAWYQEKAIENTLKAWTGPYQTVKQPTQTISYVSAHDNFTLWDKMVFAEGLSESGFTMPNAKLMEANRLAAVIVMLSQGIPFMQAGEEFARTKLGDGNSYRSDPSINRLDWQRTGMFADLVAYYKGLIKLRHAFKPFTCSSCETVRNMVFVQDIHQMVAFTVPGTDEDAWSMIAVILNALEREQEVRLVSWCDHPLPDEWDILVNHQSAGTESLGTIRGNVIRVPAHSALVLGNKRSNGNE
ncbi:MAG: type I pullulanase [Firmicutes bacterium]|nr:type I pullulanase [Bacillota bacterium]